MARAGVSAKNGADNKTVEQDTVIKCVFSIIDKIAEIRKENGQELKIDLITVSDGYKLLLKLDRKGRNVFDILSEIKEDLPEFEYKKLDKEIELILSFYDEDITKLLKMFYPNYADSYTGTSKEADLVWSIFQLMHLFYRAGINLPN